MLNKTLKFYTCALLTSLTLFAPLSQAAWQLDGKASMVSFNSIKKGQVVETHTFERLTGTVANSGKVSLSIDLSSVETLIPIRNQRMAEMLFETTKYPEARVSAEVPLDTLRNLKQGAVSKVMLKLSVELHGETVAVSTDAFVSRLAVNDYQVTSLKPVVVDAAKFKLAQGLEALREIAALPSITSQVPVNFTLVFREIKQDATTHL